MKVNFEIRMTNGEENGALELYEKGKVCGAFSLTPALSRWARGNHAPLIFRFGGLC